MFFCTDRLIASMQNKIKRKKHLNVKLGRLLGEVFLLSAFSPTECVI